MRILAALLLLPLASCSPSNAAQERVVTGATFTCTPTRVWDGDGPIWCAEGPRIRLGGIAAREMDGTCRRSHPCPAADPMASRDHLANLLGEVTGTAPQEHLLVRGPAPSCSSKGSAGRSRTGAWCVSPTAGDLSCRMLADRMAAKWDRYWRGSRC